MKLPKKAPFWVSLVAGLVLFIGTIPFNHDMYIPKVFTFVCVVLNGLSAVLFAKFLYRIRTKDLGAERTGAFAVGIIFQAIAHCVFAVMNWGSWLFLGLSVIALVVLAVVHFRDKKTCKD